MSKTLDDSGSNRKKVDNNDLLAMRAPVPWWRTRT